MAKTKWLANRAGKGSINLSDLQVLFKADLANNEVELITEAKEKEKIKLSRVDRLINSINKRDEIAEKINRKNRKFESVYMPFNGVAIINGSKGKLKLESRAYTTNKEKAVCQNCRITTQPTWVYAKSNYGEVTLCSRCRTVAIDESFSHGDALSLKVNHAHAKRGKW